MIRFVPITLAALLTLGCGSSQLVVPPKPIKPAPVQPKLQPKPQPQPVRITPPPPPPVRGEVPPLAAKTNCIVGVYDITDAPDWNAGERNRDVVLGERVRGVVEAAGQQLVLIDVSDGLPIASVIRDCGGIVTAMSDASLVEAEAYVDWLKANMDAGRKLVVLNNFGAYQSKHTGAWLEHALLNTVFGALGLTYDGQWTNKTKLLKVTFTDRKAFLRVPKTRDAKHYFRFAKAREDVTVHLEVTRRKLKGGGKSAVVMTSNTGGLALTRYYEDVDGREYLSLGRFLGRALGL